ncbi:restriction endonuclease subunit S [Vibrio rotiferianus]|nr:restriction endonuclease subunit S [Vibrio rotiferianus]
MTDIIIEQLPKYELMQDSGFEWIGDLPSSWNLLSVKQIYRLVMEESGKNHSLELLSVYSDIGVRPRAELQEKGNKASSTDGYWLVRKGDFVVNKLLAWMGGLGLSEYDGVTSPAYDVLRPRKEICGSYFNYLFRSPACTSELKKHSRGIMDMRLRLYFDKFGVVKVPFPSLQEQKAISTFLDKKTLKIDEAIAIKQKQIELLKERKHIIIQQAVTQGLNPDAPMKDSDVDWIGIIPEHWEVRRSKFLFTQRKEKAWKDDVQLSATQKFGVIPQDEYEARTGARVVKIQFHLDKRKHVEKDDFVISMRSFQGGLERAWSRGCIRSSYVILRPLEPIEPNFYGYLLKLPMYIKALQRTASFIRDGQDLNFDNFSQVDLFIPPLEEQKAIADYVRGFMESSDDGISLMEEQIAKLKEYKTTLINSAVTGKIKVTELA